MRHRAPVARTSVTASRWEGRPCAPSERGVDVSLARTGSHICEAGLSSAAWRLAERVSFQLQCGHSGYQHILLPVG